jgi:hypothetical protein
MKDNDWLVLLVGAAVLFFLWKKKQEQHAIAAAGAAGALTTPSPAGPTGAMAGASPGLTGAALTAAKASGTPYRAPTANGTAGGVPFGAMPINRNAVRPKPSTQATSSPTSRALNNSTLNKAESYSIAGGVAAGKAFGIPAALSRPIAKYGNPVALGRDVVSGGKAIGSFFSSIF